MNSAASSPLGKPDFQGSAKILSRDLRRITTQNIRDTIPDILPLY
jgi:hypothetical protein